MFLPLLAASQELPGQGRGRGQEEAVAEDPAVTAVEHQVVEGRGGRGRGGEGVGEGEVGEDVVRGGQRLDRYDTG